MPEKSQRGHTNKMIKRLLLLIQKNVVGSIFEVPGGACPLSESQSDGRAAGRAQEALRKDLLALPGLSEKARTAIADDPGWFLPMVEKKP